MHSVPTLISIQSLTIPKHLLLLFTCHLDFVYLYLLFQVTGFYHAVHAQISVSYTSFSQIFTCFRENKNKIKRKFNYIYFAVIADIDDLNICYVLWSEENATSDIFHFSVEDRGKSPPFIFLFAFRFWPLLHPQRLYSEVKCFQMTFQQNVDGLA